MHLASFITGLVCGALLVLGFFAITSYRAWQRQQKEELQTLRPEDL